MNNEQTYSERGSVKIPPFIGPAEQRARRLANRRKLREQRKGRK